MHRTSSCKKNSSEVHDGELEFEPEGCQEGLDKDKVQDQPEQFLPVNDQPEEFFPINDQSEEFFKVQGMEDDWDYYDYVPQENLTPWDLYYQRQGVVEPTSDTQLESFSNEYEEDF